MAHQFQRNDGSNSKYPLRVSSAIVDVDCSFQLAACSSSNYAPIDSTVACYNIFANCPSSLLGFSVLEL